MELTILFIFIFICYGFSNIVVYSTLFEPVRNLFGKIHPKLGELISCMLCFPTWGGMIVSGINLFLIPSLTFTPMNMVFDDFIFSYNGFELFKIALTIILFDGFIASGTTWVIHTIQEYFEK